MCRYNKQFNLKRNNLSLLDLYLTTFEAWCRPKAIPLAIFSNFTSKDCLPIFPFSMEAFQEAREAFRLGLQPADRELFDNCDNPETLLSEIRKLESLHRHSSNGRKAVDKITPFVRQVQKYGNALDVFSNTQPAILSPIWGGTRVILEVRQNRCDSVIGL